MNSNRFINKAQFPMFVILAIFVMASACWAATYYVDATMVNDSNDGLSQSTAWKTIEKADVSNFKLGDSILFVSGEVRRENSKLKSAPKFIKHHKKKLFT